ncbi:MAG: hypothetical protein DMF86_22145 [Acidobacteria bacterium]|nr:MAG: hypothetical protein DMF86_22145 [Acidobacteriota bacterium]
MTPAGRRLAAAFAAIALILVASWIARRSIESDRRAGMARALTAADAPPGPQPALSLNVNGNRRIEVLPSTPLLFAVSLTNRSDQEVTIGGRLGSWASRVRLTQAETGAALSWSVAPLGRPETIVITANGGGAPGIDVETSGAAVVRSGRVSRMILAASPEAMAGARPGTYVMRAELEQGGLMPWGWRGHLVSAPVTIVVREADRTSNREALEGARSAMSTHYFLAADRPEDARRAALDWSQRDPKNPVPLMLLGDAVAALGRPRAALTIYRAALKVSPRSYEPPALLYDRIVKLSARK